MSFEFSPPVVEAVFFSTRRKEKSPGNYLVLLSFETLDELIDEVAR